MCFVCRKTDKWKRDYKSKESLLVCESDDVEAKIGEAANIRSDTRVNLDIANQDL